MRRCAFESGASLHVVGALVLALVAPSCSSSREESGPVVGSDRAPVVVADSARAPHPSFALPVTFVRQDETGRARETVSLRSDGVFFERHSASDAGSDGEPRHDWGRWKVSDDGERLVLYGGREAPRLLAIESSDVLTPLDDEGRVTGGGEAARLHRSDLYDPIRDTVRLIGEAVCAPDVAAFTECLTRHRFPVAPELDYPALEAAYLEAHPAPGAKLLVSLHGHFEERPRPDEGGTHEVLIVDHFEQAWPSRDCPAGTQYQAPLRNTYWKLVEALGERVGVAEGRREPYMVLENEPPRVQGHLGCRSFTASYRHEESYLHFAAVAVSKEECPQGSEIESTFTRVLESCTSYRVEGETLLLYGEEEAIARFVAVYLR